jgi:hypothetical protein
MPYLKKALLGEFLPSLQRFSNVEDFFDQFSKPEFNLLATREKFSLVCRAILNMIQQAKAPCFLLGALLDLIARINEEKITDESFSFAQFESYLNQFSTLTKEENQLVRGKIVGRYIPRDDYQVFFPVGMGKMFGGSHFVAAHLSPDVDTTISSFWGWVDAVGCRVAEGTQQWSLPSGLSDGHIQLYLKRMFGEHFFSTAPRQLQTITLSAQDLLTKRNFFKIPSRESRQHIDFSTGEHAVIVVDEEGFYEGEWRSLDAEVVGQIIASFMNCLHWFEGRAYARLMGVLAQEHLHTEDVRTAYEELLKLSIQDSPSIKDLPSQAKAFIDQYLKEVLLVEGGLKSSFGTLSERLDRQFSSGFNLFITHCGHIHSKEYVDERGNSTLGRIEAARLAHQAIKSLEGSVEVVRKEISRLAHLLEVKQKVAQGLLNYVTLQSDVDEMRSKIGHLDYLTVVTIDKSGKLYPIGIVYADELRKSSLGTASFRDFSSLEETKMASYIDVVSIVDHHKTNLTTNTPTTLLISDAQSSNTLLGEMSLALNKRYGATFHEAQELLESIKDKTLRNKLLDVLSLSPAKNDYFVASSREIIEYFSYIYAILDDTDLLTKVSKKDVLCMKGLLDRLRSLVDNKASESVSFAHLSLKDPKFVKKAAKALLQSEDLYSIYRHMYAFKEEEVERAMNDLLSLRESTFFLDTKEQNGCCRVGQAKFFLKNLPSLQKHRAAIINRWQKQCEGLHQIRPHIDFFLQMVSTITSADAVFHGHEAAWKHQDEMWIYIPNEGVAEQHLISFLNNFQNSSCGKELPFIVEVFGDKTQKLASLLRQNFSVSSEIIVSEQSEGPTLIVFRFPAGKINSRKGQISPYLPKVVS